MRKREATRLGALLEKMSKDPNGYIPQETWTALQKVIALPYVELCIIRRWLGRIEILLTHRFDEHWNGWHIPGGLWRTQHTLTDCIESLVCSEGLGTDVRVSLLAQGMWEKWHDHPYGNPISHIVICSAVGIVETETMKWFSVVPNGLIDDGGHHGRFIQDALLRAESLL